MIEKKKNLKRKKHEQKGKVAIIGLLLPKTFEKWHYMKWNLKHSQCPPKAPPNWYGHLKQLGYHEP